MARSSSFTASFDEGVFRDAIYNTMLMGLPENPAERLTFYWKRNQTYSPDDPAGNPYDWTSAPITDAPGNPTAADDGAEQAVQVPYALEFSARPAGSSNTVFGEIDTSRAVVTMMEVDFQKVRTADYAAIDDSKYRIQFDAPPQGLFGVTIWTLYLEAVDQA